MADDIPPTLTELAESIAATRTLYADTRASLETTLGAFFDKPAEVADELLSLADEFGRDQALDVYAGRLPDGTDRAQLSDLLSSERMSDVTAQIESLVDTQDRLDDLTDKREKLAARDNAPVVRVFNIQGQEFVLDGRLGEFHAVDRPDDRLMFEPEPELSLTEQVARDVGAANAEPQPLQRDRDRTRSR